MMKPLVLFLLSLVFVTRTYSQAVQTSDINELVSVAERSELKKIRPRKSRVFMEKYFAIFDSVRIEYNYNAKNLSIRDTLILLTEFDPGDSYCYSECFIERNQVVGFFAIPKEGHWKCCDYKPCLSGNLLITYMRLTWDWKGVIRECSQKKKVQHLFGCPRTRLVLFVKQPNGEYKYEIYSTCSCRIVKNYVNIDSEVLWWEIYNNRKIDDETMKQIISKFK